MLTFKITPGDHCRRVESFLGNLLPAAPLSYRRRLIKSGHLAINGSTAAPGAILRLADTVTIKESAKTRAFLGKDKPALDILYEDQWIVAFNKPPGLPMHRTAEDGGLNLVELGEKLLAGDAGPVKLRPVNRLDRGTSGAVIMAKSSVAAGMFGRVVKEVGLDKLYLAVVEGGLPEEGGITAPLEGKEAETFYRQLYKGEEGSLVAVYPLTGRMHQIRQHFRLAGHPVWGDKRYGGRPLAGFTGHALHSFRTILTHPATGERLAILAPLPEGLLSLMERIAGTAYTSVLQGFPDIPPRTG